MAAPRRFRLPSWAPWLLVVASLPFGFIGWMAARATGNRSQAWPILQRVVPRLQDAAQARLLWDHNPALHGIYPDAETFQAELAAWLPRFGGLPGHEPEEAAEAYGIGADPFEVRIALKGIGGVWMYLAVEGQEPFGLGQNKGEGITRLFFAEQRAGLTERQRQLRSKSSQELWARFRGVEAQLRDEAKARRLWTAEARLHRTFKAQEDLLRATAPWRRALPGLPTDLDAAKEASLHINESPFGRTESVGYPGPDGLMLWVTWRDGCLDGIDPTLDVPGH